MAGLLRSDKIEAFGNKFHAKLFFLMSYTKE